MSEQELSSLTDLFTGEDPAVRFYIKRSSNCSSKIMYLSIRHCPFTGKRFRFNRHRRTISGVSHKEVFTELWQHMVKTLELEESEILRRLEILVRHSLVGWEC